MSGTRGDSAHAVTPDGRYLVVRGRLWRRADPRLAPAKRERLVHELMDARRAVRDAGSPPALAAARARVDAAKRALGERGPVWWSDGAPDLTRRMARNTCYRAWFETLGAMPPARPPDAESGARGSGARGEPQCRVPDGVPPSSQPRNSSDG